MYSIFDSPPVPLQTSIYCMHANINFIKPHEEGLKKHKVKEKTMDELLTSSYGYQCLFCFVHQGMCDYIPLKAL